MALSEQYSRDDLDDEAVLEFFRKHSDPALTAPELAAAFDVSNQALNKRLKRLCDNDRLKRKKVGGAAVIYWIQG